MEIYHLAGQGRIKRALEPILIKNEKTFFIVIPASLVG